MRSNDHLFLRYQLSDRTERTCHELDRPHRHRGSGPCRCPCRRSPPEGTATKGRSRWSATSRSGPTCARLSRRSTSAARRDREQVYVHPATFYAEHRIDLRPATAVRAIEPGSREVVLEGEERVRVRPAASSRPAHGRGRCRCRARTCPASSTLRTLAEADAIHAAAIDAERIVVIGAGWIGSEVAASLRMLGRTVVLIAPEVVPLERVLGPEIGGVYRDVHRRARRGLATRDDRRTARRDRPGPGRRDFGRGADRGRPCRGRRRRPAPDGIGRGGGHRRRRRGRGQCDARDVRARDLRGRGRRLGVASLLRPATSKRALGEREVPGLGRRSIDAGCDRSVRPDSVLLLRPVRRRDGVHGSRLRVGPARRPGQPCRSTSSSRSGLPTVEWSPG